MTYKIEIADLKLALKPSATAITLAVPTKRIILQEISLKVFGLQNWKPI